jgi:hypothetical protein
VGTTAFGGGGFTVWGCFSLNCKIDLYVIGGTLRGQKYRDQILHSLVVLARNLALLRHLLTVRLLMRLLTIHCLRSVYVILNGCCLPSILRSLFFLGVIFRDLSV